MPPLADEIKDGQWLGVSVSSQGPGRKVMVSVLLFPLTFTIEMFIIVGNRPCFYN